LLNLTKSHPNGQLEAVGQIKIQNYFILFILVSVRIIFLRETPFIRVFFHKEELLSFNDKILLDDKEDIIKLVCPILLVTDGAKACPETILSQAP
jgi:hypothetical protein